MSGKNKKDTKINIFFLTQFFDPEPNIKGLIFAKELSKNNINVKVITSFPNYPGGKIYPGYKLKIFQREVINKIEITRLPIFPSHDKSIIKRFISYLSFAFSALIFGLFYIPKKSIVYVYHPPIFMGLVACILKRLKAIKVLYDIQDFWPDALLATKVVKNRNLIRFINLICYFVYKNVDYINVLSPGFKNKLVKNGIPLSKISVIYNWADIKKLEYIEKRNDYKSESIKKETFDILFSGNIGPAQSLTTILNVAIILMKKNSNIRFIFLGSGIEKNFLENEVKRLKIKNIIFKERVPMSKMGFHFKNADALLVHLKDESIFQITIPSKLQAYMAFGKPIIMAVKGDAADIVEKSRSGLLAKPEDVDSIVNAVELMSTLDKSDLSKFGKNAKSFYRKNMSIEVGTSKFEKIIRSMVEN